MKTGEQKNSDKDKRTAEFVLGLIGGIFGFFGGVIVLIIAAMATAFVSSISGESASAAGMSGYLGWFAILFSILGIVGAVVVKSKQRWGGAMMLISAVGGLISISFFYILPFILLLIGGLMGLLKKKDSE